MDILRLCIPFDAVRRLLLELDLNALLLISGNIDGLRMRFKAFPFQHHRMLPYRQGKGLGGRRGTLIRIVDINFRPWV